MLFKKDVVEHILPIPSDVLFHDTWIASVACLTGGINYVDSSLMKYRRTSSSITGERLCRKSKFAHFKELRLGPDKYSLVRNLQYRLHTLDSKQESLLVELAAYCKRNGNRWGRRLNTLYMIRHYKSIFNCDYSHWI